MMETIKLNITIDKDWLEATWIKEVTTINDVENEVEVDGKLIKEVVQEESVTTEQVHCESFSGHPEHIAMLRAKAKEYGTELDEALIKECIKNFKMPTAEEIAVEANKAKLQEAYAYLISTAWYIERFNDPSSGKAIPQEILDGRAQARVTINELEVV